MLILNIFNLAFENCVMFFGKLVSRSREQNVNRCTVRGMARRIRVKVSEIRL